MMTMLHSVWSGGGSAAGRRRSLLALGALLALVASVLIWATPTQAQGTNQPPTAIALPVTFNNAETPDDASDDTLVLDGSLSFDPDDTDLTGDPDPCTGCTYKWEIVTSTYIWMTGFIADGGAAETTTLALENINLQSLAASAGPVIEFKLTVTDAKGASDSANVTYNIETTAKPTAVIAVTAFTSGEGVDTDKDGAISALEKFSDDAVIDGPGENGNADNEYDIKEDSLLVLDASGSSDPDSQSLTYTWTRVFETGQTASCCTRYPRHTDSAAQSSTVAPDDNSNVLYNVGADNTKVSTNKVEDADTVIETVGRLNVGVRNQSPYYVIYRLTATDADENAGTATVRIAIHDQPADPTVNISIEGDNPQTPDVETADNDPTPRPDLQGTLPPGSGRYVVHPGTEFVLNATAYDADFDTDSSGALESVETEDVPGAPVATWSGDLKDADTTEAGFQVKIPDDAADGTSYTLTATIRGTQISKSMTFVVAKGNRRPIATILTSNADHDTNLVTPNVADVTPKNGVYTLNGFGHDPDAGSVTTAWTQIINGKAAEADHDDYVALTGAFSKSVSFNKPTNPKHSGNVILSFAVIDNKGAFDIKTVLVNITPGPTAPAAGNAGANQVVAPESTVVLSASATGFDADSTVTYEWTVTSVTTNPATTSLSLRASTQVHKDLNDLLEVLSGEDQEGDADNSAKTIGEILTPISGTTGGTGPFQYFTAPKLSAGLKYVRITFNVSATGDVDDASTTKNDEVSITVATKFFSGYVDNPDFCRGPSVGGPTTQPHDGDGDGVADVCSLPYTRREAVARQNALDTLVGIGSTLNVTDADDRTSAATLTDLVLGREGKDAVASPETPAVSTVIGTCVAAKALNLRHDDKDACDDDATALTPLPEAVDPADAGVYYSGIITGPDWCTNYALGGAKLYAHDKDRDGVADVCSLPYTRREAAARQMALEKFTAHPQFENAFKVACVALGSQTFGATAEDLAKDACAVGLNPQSPTRGTPLPTRPTS